MQFNYETQQVIGQSEEELREWIAMLHGVMINCGAWDRLAAYDSETALQLQVLANV